MSCYTSYGSLEDCRSEIKSRIIVVQGDMLVQILVHDVASLCSVRLPSQDTIIQGKMIYDDKELTIFVGVLTSNVLAVRNMLVVIQW